MLDPLFHYPIIALPVSHSTIRLFLWHSQVHWSDLHFLAYPFVIFEDRAEWYKA
jgi:hypothetical protein